MINLKQLAFLLLAVLGALPAMAETVAAKYKWDQDAIPFYYNPEGQPEWLTTEEVLDMLRQAAGEWEVCGPRVPIAGITFAKAAKKDAKNVIGWVDNAAMRNLYDKSFNGFTQVTASAKFQQNKTQAPAGYGFSWMDQDAVIREYDILFNSSIFGKDTANARKELYHDMLHELGHAVAFNGVHTTDRTMIMSTDQRSQSELPIKIHPLEIEACQKLYGN